VFLIVVGSVSGKDRFVSGVLKLFPEGRIMRTERDGSTTISGLKVQSGNGTDNKNNRELPKIY